jgi:hypothetical protein
MKRRRPLSINMVQLHSSPALTQKHLHAILSEAVLGHLSDMAADNLTSLTNFLVHLEGEVVLVLLHLLRTLGVQISKPPLE